MVVEEISCGYGSSNGTAYTAGAPFPPPIASDLTSSVSSLSTVALFFIFANHTPVYTVPMLRCIIPPTCCFLFSLAPTRVLLRHLGLGSSLCISVVRTVSSVGVKHGTAHGMHTAACQHSGEAMVRVDVHSHATGFKGNVAGHHPAPHSMPHLLEHRQTKTFSTPHLQVESFPVQGQAPTWFRFWKLDVPSNATTSSEERTSAEG